MDKSQYTEIFLSETAELLQTLNDDLLKLEEDPGDREVLNEIFRSTHTLKGNAATMGLERFSSLAHQMESALELFKEGKVEVDSGAIDLLLDCRDQLETMAGEVNSESKSDPAPLIAKLKALIGAAGKEETAPSVEKAPGKETAPAAKTGGAGNTIELNQFDRHLIKEAAESGYRCYQAEIALEPGTVMGSVRALMVFQAIEQGGQIIRCEPPAEDLEEDKFNGRFQVLFVTEDKPDFFTDAIGRVGEVNLVSLEPVELAETKGKSPLAVSSGSSGKKKSRPSREGITMHSVRVGIDRLDNLLNLVGELVINKTRLEQIASTSSQHELQEAIERMGRLIAQLQTLVMKIRMVPVAQVFNRFPRMVRDLARETGKQVNFIMEGEETEVDRSVVDEIGEPLVHLIRNGVDHGLESPAERRPAGKEETGVLCLSASHEGNQVVIEVRDDGKGIDTELVRQKAVEQGLLKAEERPPEKELFSLIFQPGFTTSSQVTDISGRGVGMDVVKTKVESLNGSIEIDSRRGEGTAVSIRLPLTLAIIQALMVRVGEEEYALPISVIDETTYLSQKQIKHVRQQEAMLLRGKVIPLFRLKQLLAVPGESRESNGAYVVVVRRRQRQIGLVVDSLIGQQDIVIKPLGKILRGLPGIAGATILGNGRVALILEVNGLNCGGDDDGRA